MRTRTILSAISPMLVALSSTAACGGKAADAPAADAAASSQGDAADAGSGEAGASPSDASANRLDATSAPEAGADAAAGAGAGLGSIYNGYFESYAFPSGSDAIKLEIEPTGLTVNGIAIIGAPTPPPMPTNPAVGYPPGFDDNGSPLPAEPTLVEGYGYHFIAGSLTGTRLVFQLDLLEAWVPWCALQTSYPQTNGTYGCIPQACGVQMGMTCAIGLCGDASAENLTIDCGKLVLCGQGGMGPSVCACTASVCVHPLSPTISFDLMLSPGHLDGSTSGLPNTTGNVNVHLVEQ